MIDLIQSADPASHVEIDRDRLMSLVESRIGVTPHLAPIERRRSRWPLALAAAVILAVIAFPILSRDDPSIFAPEYAGILNTPGIEELVPIGAGVSTMGVDGDDIWVMSALFNELKRIGATSGETEATYQIDAYVEGVTPGAGYIWLMSYDNDGEVLRFNPATGTVDLTISLPGSPWHAARWFADRLWVSDDQGELFTISANGELTSMGAGSVVGEGLGYLWINDQETRSIYTLTEDGSPGQYDIAYGEDPIADLRETFTVSDAGGFLWLLVAERPEDPTGLYRFDPDTEDLLSVAVGPGLHGMTEHDGYLWVISYIDHLLIRVDPTTLEIVRHPMPGKTGGIVEANGSLWVDLFHPGAVVRVDTDAALIESGEIVFDYFTQGHRFMCTGGADARAGSPTIILEPIQWVGHGWWSVVQGLLAAEGYRVCVDGNIDPERSPGRRAADLTATLDAGEMPGPYLVVTGGDGVHTTRILLAGRSDIVGVVMVDPAPLGFSDFLADLLESPGNDGSGAPPTADLDPVVSAELGGLGDIPLVVIGHDPGAVFLSDGFVKSYGEAAEAANRYWQDGLAFYAGLSSSSRLVEATGTGLHMVVWDRPDLIVDEVLALLDGG